MSGADTSSTPDPTDGHDPGGADDTSAVPGPDTMRYRELMARFGTGVTVMTSMDADGEVTGMTANAVASVSLEPLLVLVCVDRATDMARRVVSGQHFGLSILAADQQERSNHFANPSRSRGWQGFADVPVTTATTGVPLLADGLGWLDCRVHAIHPGGDHLIVVGEVVALDLGRDDDALGWFAHDYTTISRP